MYLVTIEEHPELEDQLEPLIQSVWPPFMLNDPVANKYWGRLFSDFPECQIAMVEGDSIIGAGNSVPISWDKSLEDLPDEGWDWALETAMEEADAGRQPASLIGLQIVIARDHQGKGLSSQMVQKLKDIATQKSLERVIIPVRPTLKHKYPLTPIERYIEWQKDDLPFDPWLRVHIRAGGQIIKPCTRAMTITGTVSEWESWTDMAFPESGEYIVPQALTPVTIDREQNKGTYIEPNVWVEHKA
ncbi:MAG: GNAT family N-acetyltransferase [Candidatus Latescibacteria bacterium]|jgi:GNAT superfamily N-acetyltransferase|nr:GNAT family N-acetyltransferase [Candidatus Latescibacterota bacterium]